ncbi:hypothetical protein M1B74_11560 [Bacteroides pyogenes]|uniref:hypothetical protein n=1 Tax=Bacteroides pyogenes TaxID=310300 RepID=UPI003B435050
MAKITPVSVAEKIMGTNIIGPKQANMLLEKMGKEPIAVASVPEVNYDEDTLTNCASDYILVYGTDTLDILDLRNFFGVDPEISEPCLYNQDWYMSEDFIRRRMDNKWYLIKKNVLEDTRAVMPLDIISNGVKFPSAILCVFTFFAYYVAYGEILWYHDFVWCEDVDHNGDRIYVAKYHDVDGINKNGFSIHRHLALRPCYASVDII